ncbi:TetR/AcrR family transcriptional regulator [Actinoplanes sp. NPDC051851]|uniref:TetR/AcrR family transcriptional regulator n=1 Tax=Actinoplanes sp. NPDC051851 TaxID=3154753 RepID=UPI00343F6688
MSDALETGTPPRRRRSDARRSIDAILGAARTLLAERPDASMEQLAAAAGVTRQTVYAHFASRDALISALIEAAGAEAVAALEAANLDALPPADALCRYLDIGWELIRRYPYLLATALARTPPGNEATHTEGAALFERIVRRGRQTGDFDVALPAGWLTAAVVGLVGTAATEVAAGRLGADEAHAAFLASALRLCGVRGRTSGDGVRGRTLGDAVT